MKRKLNDTHSFNIYIAKEFGINSAVIIHNLIYWLEKNEANDKNFHEGRYWSYNSISAYAELFPYLSERQIRYSLDKLEEENIIMTGDFNKVGFDKTKWYSLTDYGLKYLQSVMHVYTKCTKDIHKVSKPIPDINTDVNTDVNIDNKTIVQKEEWFNTFWKEYPRKTNKKNAKRTFLRIINEELYQTILADIRVRKNTKDWTKDKGKFVPHPTTYLNGERWNDQIKGSNQPKQEQENYLGIEEI